MKKFSKNKIALFLACISVLGNKAQTIDSKPENRKLIKAVLGILGGIDALEVVHSIIGVATNSKIGSYSIGRGIKNLMVNKEALK